MNLILIQSFALLAYLNCLTETKDFCQAFLGNGHRISYTNIFDGKSHQYLIDVVINDFYWRLETNDHIFKSLKLEFLDPSMNGKPNLLFYKSQYSTTLVACDLKSCSLLLINTTSWKALISGSYDRTNPESIRYINEVQLNGFNGTPFSAFQTDFLETEYKNRIVFVEYNNKTGLLKASAYQKFNLDGSEIKAKSIGLDRRMVFLTKNINKTNLLSLNSVYSISQVWHWDKKDSWGFLLLFEENGRVMWCWNHHNSDVSAQCKTGKLLVDCSSIILETEKSSLWITTAIIVVCIAVLLLILIIFCVLREKPKIGNENTSENTSAVSTTSGISTGLSKAFNARPQTSTTSKISAAPSKKFSPKAKK